MITRHHAPARPPKKLSEDLFHLMNEFGEHPVTLRAVLVLLRGRAYIFVIILLALPFLQPIPLPGLSTPFGLAIVLIAVRLSLGQRPWLPKKIQRVKIPPGFFPKVILAAAKFIRFIEKFLRPRWLALTESGLLRQLHAVVILVAASILLLPLPVPFSNNMPAWAILLVAAGLLERDGWFIFFGYAMLVLSILYLWLFGEMAAHALDVIWQWLKARGHI
ncbi:MAG TPA: exopolysaccharide biosynthesis protein [Candidatus Didemnitutus sp.]|nr:exopolysaccharide biosynthesis protein [Candidatus Didemnitutus sp.]